MCCMLSFSGKQTFKWRSTWKKFIKEYSWNVICEGKEGNRMRQRKKLGYSANCWLLWTRPIPPEQSRVKERGRVFITLSQVMWKPWKWCDLEHSSSEKERERRRRRRWRKGKGKRKRKGRGREEERWSSSMAKSINKEPHNLGPNRISIDLLVTLGVICILPVIQFFHL